MRAIPTSLSGLLHLTACSVAACSIAGCGPGSTSAVPLESWCVELGSALRDQHVACGCAGETPTDEELFERCEGLDAASLSDAIDDGEVLWNGALASAILRSLDDCDRTPLQDDPVIGRVAVGEPCRVFEDVAGAPDDCAFGATCAVPLGGGEARCVEIPQCASNDDCLGRGTCEAGECVIPVCEDAGG